ncbi:hypothetical protein IWX49DRAFT_231806 [Phyllosticta citricarpa]|uniref:SUN-domain-containing protein n=1 Tax=Phyllosticta paracitricarpa TaxID=2016321 RepID=A0ABR1MVH3_9PEZI
MKPILLSSCAVFATASALALGSHHHHHYHRRNTIANEDGLEINIVTVCALGDTILSEKECEEGIASGRLRYADSPVSTVITSSTAAAFYKAKAKPTSHITSVTEAELSSTSSSSSSSTKQSTSSKQASATADVSSSVPTLSVAQGVDMDFPENIPCHVFPSEYGAVAIDYMGLGGWIGVQRAQVASAAGFDNIETMVSSLCDGPGCCSENSLCSYACPAGYQKSQWPTMQGATGQSVGGIQCKNGKLKLTNSAYSTLCIPGTNKVNVTVKNNLSGSSAVCRTDYPGTEAMTIPIDTKPGHEYPLACPDGANYYQHQGSSTSAQYYVNSMDVAVEDACVWSNGDQPVGNWAPLNLGVGYKDGRAWLAIFQNKPTTYARLNFTVELVGDNMSGRCKYSNGQYCSGENYDDCNENDGCTVSVSGGDVAFVFSDE